MTNSAQNSAFVIKTPAEFSFKQCLAFLGRSDKECLHKVDGEQIIKAIRVDGKPALFTISESSNNNLLIEPEGNYTDEAHLAITNYITDWFDLNYNLQPFYEKAESDYILQQLVSKFSGLHLIGIPDLFECLCWAITGQQINLTFAYTLKKRFVENFGEQVDPIYLHPQASVIAALDPKDLLPLQFSTKKAEYLIGIARLFADGTLSKEKLSGMNIHEVESSLVKIRGIGKWSAHYAAMKCLRLAPALPAEDAGLQNAIKNILQLDSKPGPAEVRELFEQWQGIESYVAFYLWRWPGN